MNTRETTMSVEIKSYRSIRKGAVMGEFGVYMPKIGLLIRRVKVLENEKGRWLSFPAFKFEKDGQEKWCPYFQFTDKAVEEKFKEAILTALKPFLECEQGEDTDELF